MAAALIDDRVIMRIVATALAGVADATLRVPGDPQDGEIRAPLIRLVSIDTESTPRQPRDNEPDMALISVTVSIIVDSETTRVDRFALERFVSRVRAVLERRGMGDAATNHWIDFEAAQRASDPVGDENMMLRSAGIIVSGIAQRSAGATLE